MKKVIVLVGIVIFIFMIIGILVTKKKFNMEENFEIANVINDNSYLPIKYMSKYGENSADFKEYEKINNYMSTDFYSKDRDVVFKYYGYPNDESEYYLGEISISTNIYNILGITVGDIVESSINKLKEYGFELEVVDANEYILKYKDYNIKIETTKANNNELVVEKINLRVDSKYLGRMLY